MYESKFSKLEEHIKFLEDRIEKLEMVVMFKMEKAAEEGTLPDWIYKGDEMEDYEEEEICFDGRIHDYGITDSSEFPTCIKCGHVDYRKDMDA